VSIGSKAVVNGAVYAKNITTGVSSSFTFMPFGRPVQDGIIAKRVADDSEEIAEEDHIIPVEFSLPQNYPNPFNPVTTITYIIPAGVTDRVAINVYDSRGALVKTIVDQFGSPGMYSVVWDGTDTSGNRVSSGVYIYTIQAGEYRKSNKMMLMR
ncbi:MAG: T9SS type A sorting domain-containing protein, partial [Candidatus Latescibacteria bacterium]|nr:T9SS type A sorting domain-containing protein [Candidatus Latescibacterota bacterium]